MGEKYCDSTLVDKAIIFATNAHKNTERRGKGFPYIVHPLEAMSIVSTITCDPELLAAAALHDVVEDTDVTTEDIRREFGDRIAKIVDAESDNKIEGIGTKASWLQRKQHAMDHLRRASLDIKIVAMGDKLSNMRAIYRDYKEQGDNFWKLFHVKDPSIHEWRYRGLADALSDLKHTHAHREFCRLIDKVFSNIPSKELDIVNDGNVVKVAGTLNRENSLKLEQRILPGKNHVLDFQQVKDVNFAGMRTLLRMKEHGIKFTIINVRPIVANKLYDAGINKRIIFTGTTSPISLARLTESGDGFTAMSYNFNDNDSMCKLYYNYVAPESIAKEKINALEVLELGIPTPLSGRLITDGTRNGIEFERILNKKSLARALSENPEKLEEFAKIFAESSLKLHNTDCNIDAFPNIKTVYKKLVTDSLYLTEEEKKSVHSFIDKAPVAATCLHGDFHLGNFLITTEGDKLFIDLSDFAYGHPYFDLGVFYLLSHNDYDGVSEKLFHCSNELLKDFFDAFLRYYFKTEDKNEIQNIKEKLKPYAVLRAIFIGRNDSTKKWIRKKIEDWLLPVC